MLTMTGLIFLALPLGMAAGFPPPDRFREGPPNPERIEAALEFLDRGGTPGFSGESSESGELLGEFYRNRGFRPAWIRFGIPDRQAWQLLKAIRESRADGLDPADCHESILDSLLRLFQKKIFLQEQPSAGAAVELDLMLSDAFLGLGDHLLSGRVRAWPSSDRWRAGRERFDLPGRLEAALVSGEDMRAVARSLAPPQPEYLLMKQYLASYRDIRDAGGWPAIPPGSALRTGSSGPRAGILCRRLAIEGYLPAQSCADSLTPGTAEAVRKFQTRHGLDTTGVVGKAELAQLNIDVDHRIAQIKINLECWRRLPRNPGPRHVRVNLADFRLSAFEGGKEALRMKVVIGRREDRTPIFSDSIVAVALNPPWNVPAIIAEEEILPELRKNPGYLESHEMELLPNRNADAAPIPAEGIAWDSIPEGKFPYRIRQKPGEANALGKIKFVMTNPFNIYLHDTPATAFFGMNERAFSHGCVRVEKPLDLALWLLAGAVPDWDRKKLIGRIAKGNQESLPIPGGGLPVFILYWTAFTDPEGALNFRKDIYGWDAVLRAAFPEPSGRRQPGPPVVSAISPTDS